MKILALTLAAALALSGCNATVATVDNTLAKLAKNQIPAACKIISVAEGYFGAVKARAPAIAVAAEATAEATVEVICASPPTDLAAAFSTLLNAWTTIAAATKVTP